MGRKWFGGWEPAEKDGWLVECAMELLEREGWDEREALNNDEEPRPLDDNDDLLES